MSLAAISSKLEEGSAAEMEVSMMEVVLSTMVELLENGDVVLNTKSTLWLNWKWKEKTCTDDILSSLASPATVCQAFPAIRGE